MSGVIFHRIRTSQVRIPNFCNFFPFPRFPLFTTRPSLVNFSSREGAAYRPTFMRRRHVGIDFWTCGPPPEARATAATEKTTPNQPRTKCRRPMRAAAIAKVSAGPTRLAAGGKRPARRGHPATAQAQWPKEVSPDAIMSTPHDELSRAGHHHTSHPSSGAWVPRQT
ncbi:hypothetical protein LX32DRAFT_245318 [Colletotrichum zoysiae]|uniref:Uncharacterized protein n=1 Tax=Colletotrichum zoysiae TaxID=1216348 RepID=A0AAD9HPL4_9PEZI|nr:hypothetical protein LX32DRAFT_245318 [Colletotrichum zoysiae]